MGSVTIWVQMFQIFKFEICWKHVEKLCWKFQCMLKTVMHVEKCAENFNACWKCVEIAKLWSFLPIFVYNSINEIKNWYY